MGACHKERDRFSPIPWTDMFQTAARQRAFTSPDVQSSGRLRESDEQLCEEDRRQDGEWKFNRKSYRLAIYVAMAHAALIFLLAVLYGVWKLLEDFRKPIQWALLCSMPLREIQRTMVAFWEPPLKKGLVETVLAVPLAICKALVGTALDARFAIHALFGKPDAIPGREVRFSTLVEWLVSFAVFTLGYEFFGPAALASGAFLGMITYAAGISLGIVEPIAGDIDVQATLRILSTGNSPQGEHARNRLPWVFSIFVKVYKRINTRLTQGFVAHLHTVVAILLISSMIIGSLAGLVLFSYKVALEGKDAVIALRTHVQKNNYAERVGLKQFMEDNQIPLLINIYTAKAYQIVSDQIDAFAAQYNMTELAEAGKNYVVGLVQGNNTTVNAFKSSTPARSHPILEKLLNARLSFQEYNFKEAYSELEQAAIILLAHFQLSKEDLTDKIKQLGQRWLDIGKQVVASSSMLFSGGTYFLFSMASSIASGAVEFINFIAQAATFFSLLCYLITSPSGGVMEHVLGMVPLSQATRRRCASVLDHTISSVLLATVKAAIFQAVFTWFLFRFLRIHFLYMSTMLAFFNVFLPLFPSWLSSLPAVAQIAFEGYYIKAVLLMVAHTWILDFGVSAIHGGIPGYNAYLMGLSIAGGMALFSPAFEGAIMGPVIMTMMISVKNLYSEFVLTATKC